MNLGNAVMAVEPGRLTLRGDGEHEKYVAVVRGATEAPRVLVGAWTPQSAGPAKAMFMVDMDLGTAREYGKRILDACDMVDADVDEAELQPKQ